MLFMSCFASGDDFSNSPFRPHREDEAPLMHMLHALLVSNRNFFFARIGMLYCCCGWWHGTVVERRYLAGELSLSCARPAADG